MSSKRILRVVIDKKHIMLDNVNYYGAVYAADQNLPINKKSSTVIKGNEYFKEL